MIHRHDKSSHLVMSLHGMIDHSPSVVVNVQQMLHRMMVMKWKTTRHG
jgi:hypothetical protein